jgi:hypothetical protein
MHAWEGNPRLDEQSEYRSQALTQERTRSKAARPLSFNWRVVAGIGAASLLGMPFMAPAMAHAAWAQFSHMFASLRR